MELRAPRDLLDKRLQSLYLNPLWLARVHVLPAHRQKGWVAIGNKVISLQGGLVVVRLKFRMEGLV